MIHTVSIFLNISLVLCIRKNIRNDDDYHAIEGGIKGIKMHLNVMQEHWKARGSPNSEGLLNMFPKTSSLTLPRAFNCGEERFCFYFKSNSTQ